MAEKKKDTKLLLKKGKAQFTLVGNVKVNEYTFDLDKTYDSGWTSNILNLGVDCGNGNTVYAEMSGGYFPAKYKRDNVVYVHGIKEVDGKKQDDFQDSFTIDWDDRFDETILETVGRNCFVTVGIEKTDKDKTFYKDFLTEYDAVAYLAENLKDGTTVYVRGNIAYESDGEKVYVKKKITNIALSEAKPENFKATFTQTILLDDGSIGKPDKEKNTIPISAYVVDYVGKPKIDDKKIEVKKNFAFPVNFEFGIGDNAELTAKQLSKFFKAKKNEIIEISVDGNIIEGASIVNITKDDLPDDIKELIELGLYTEEEALTKCAVGNTSREKRMIITKPTITYVGEGDDRKPTVASDRTKYKPDDISLYSTFLATLETGEKVSDKGNTNSEDIEDDEDSDLLDMLNALDD
jgi:hypothetical protein